MIFRLLSGLLLFVSFSVNANYKMHFSLPNFPPYTMIQDGKAAGLGVNAVLPILDALNVSYTIRVNSNHGRALQDLISGNSDGFFMASKNAQRDKYAVFSKPIVANRWIWVLSKNSTLNPKSTYFKKNKKAASLLNTNTLKWLEKNDYQISGKTSNANSLVRFLDANRADAIFLAEEVFKESVDNSNNYKIVDQIEKDFGVYISKRFLSKNPDFMDKFNKQVKRHIESQ